MSGIERSRRTFLRTVGAAVATLPFYRLLERSAVAQSMPQPPQRFVAVFQGNGTPVEFWRPQANFTINGLNQSLQPFDDPATYGMSFKNNLVVLDGISNVVAAESNSGGHGAGPCIWTGSINSSNGPQCESLETFLGVTQGLGNSTLFPTTLYRQAGPSSYGAGGVELAALGDPEGIFTTLFANYRPNNMSAQAQADAIARGQSSLDFITGTLTSLQGRLASTEKQLLDQHLMAIRQIENRLTAVMPVCTPPADPMCPQYSGCIANNETPNTNADTINQMVVDMFAQAIACDLTRFISMALIDPGNPIGSTAQDPGVNPPIPVSYPGGSNVCSDNPANNQDCDHLDVAHGYVTSNPFTLGGGSGGNGAADITSQIRLARLNKYYNQYLASLAQQLAGFGLLDSTLIMTMCDVGNPALHDCVNLPTILLGGANGNLRMGQYIQLAPNTPQNHAFVSIANAFGIPITSYGVSMNTSTTTGTIPGLAA